MTQTTFTPGWYAVRHCDIPGQEDTEYKYFDTPHTFTCRTLVKPDGDQMALWFGDRHQPRHPTEWQPSFERVADTSDADHWDSDQHTLGHQQMLEPIVVPRIGRKLTGKAACERASHTDFDGFSCVKNIHIGVFFDGTNNNMDRDRPTKSHSNIVSLYDAHMDDGEEHFRFYIPGVGTQFKEIGEITESSGGKSFATGGEARVHWAMLEVYNAVHRSGWGSDLLDATEMKALVTEGGNRGLKTLMRASDNKMIEIFRGIEERLHKAVQHERPVLKKIHLSVFGFSRGAAEARTFCNWIRLVSRGRIGGGELNIRFLGIFDTVASVGLADSSPVGRGFMDWAHNTQGIHGIQKTVHYVAAHEIRRSFPLSTAMDGGRWPQNTSEYVYPGAHSDVGGGYGLGDQGKATAGRSSMLSQIPLNDMYFEAYAGGVMLKDKSQMSDEIEADFVIDPDLVSAFEAYQHWSSSKHIENIAGSHRTTPDNRLRSHMQLYWHWRASKATEAQFKAMHSYEQSSEQDQIDLWESELDWREDIAAAKKQYAIAGGTVIPHSAIKLSDAQTDLLQVVNNPLPIPADVDRFFDRYVHDSHGGFWLLGPITNYDKDLFIRELIRRKDSYDRTMASAQPDSPYYTKTIREAEQYKLNSFEQKAYELSRAQPQVRGGPVFLPVMTDADAADLRQNAGPAAAFVVRHVMGTGTRREANGSGQYRRIFDEDNEFYAVLDDLKHEMGELSHEVGEFVDNVVDSARKAVDKATGAVIDASEKAADAVIDTVIDAGKSAVRDALSGGRSPML